MHDPYAQESMAPLLWDMTQSSLKIFIFLKHFVHLFMFSSTSRIYPSLYASNFIVFFLWALFHSVYHHVHFLSSILFVFLGELSEPHYKSLHVLSLTYVLLLCNVFPPWTNLPQYFILFSMLSYLVLDHV